ncbi:transcriptional regulator GlxA family with amidase domain [Pseudonocardia eucalypti]|nr:transcriptional regulator GlxA family with amidase domain [Pseudonocardia eucalypti]
MDAHRVAVLALDGVLPLDLGIPVQIFGERSLPYRLTVCGPTEAVRTDSGFAIAPCADLAAVADADTVVVPGYEPAGHRPPEPVLDALRAAHRNGRRLVSICTGAFALAAAGVLDGRKATTHWWYTAALAADYPAVRVDPGVLYVEDGPVLTSAGVSAGVDLCLHILRRDLGARTANEVARALVAAPHREGGQAQYIQAPLAAPDGGSLAATRAWAMGRLAEPLTVPDLAARAGMSERTFARRFVAETGLTPLQWLLRARVELAKELVEEDAHGLDRIAERCGLGTAANLRLHFRRLVGTTPTAYRRTFAARS